MTYDTGISGQGISIAPHVVSDMDWLHPVASFDYNSVNIYNSNYDSIVSIYSSVNTGRLSLYNRRGDVNDGMLSADGNSISIYNNVDPTASTKTISITNNIGTISISDTSDNVNTTITDEYIQVKNNNSGAYTMIYPGKIVLSDGTNVKTITPDSQ